MTILLAIFATACGGGAPDTATAPTDDSGANALLTGSFETFGRSDIDLETVQNSDVVLWFWAPW